MVKRFRNLYFLIFSSSLPPYPFAWNNWTPPAMQQSLLSPYGLRQERACISLIYLFFHFIFIFRGLCSVQPHSTMGEQSRQQQEQAERKLKKQRKSSSYPAIIQSLTRPLIYSSPRERNERMKSWRRRERERWGERGGLRKEIISSHALCAFMTLSATTSKNNHTTTVFLSFSLFFFFLVNTRGSLRPRLPKHH